MHIEDAR